MFRKYYIVCPTTTATGGTELLHQLCYHLTKLGVENYIYYLGEYEGSPVKRSFENYNVNIANSIDDSCENMLIVPETKMDVLYGYSKITKAVWWLSVDNYPGANKIKKTILHTLYRKLKDFKNSIFDKKWKHFVQSEYAKQYLINKRKIGKENIFYLSDYLNNTFITTARSKVLVRDNNILYNPKKGFEFTKLLMDALPNANWIPLVNFTADEMKMVMLRSKVYIDFGNHPGKDRIPREAAICGCCIITGLRGAAKNDIDIPIPSKYKFEDTQKNILRIKNCILECMLKFTECSEDFTEYREKINNEESIFVSDIKENLLGVRA
ncbi:hypothetical protein [Clostridium sp. BL-8]|uniref:hypothetical protein n=1 Tax=Clostridium sp. BL-8 TaxID=349938 RepID=UPI00098C10CB|nr:hypothetical protein [Clostridium sp. BL-8]OOM80324.1 hypothetical protein CLOBL_09800 [Clostridium sp. BL-8]